jgi:hypothetical protein
MERGTGSGSGMTETVGHEFSDAPRPALLSSRDEKVVSRPSGGLRAIWGYWIEMKREAAKGATHVRARRFPDR